MITGAVGILGQAPDSNAARYPAEAMGLVKGSAVVQLVTRGAHTGAERRIAITAHELGDGLFLVGSNWGRQTQPAWFHNIRADAAIEVITGGLSHPMSGRIAAGEERDRLLQIGIRNFPRYEELLRRAAPREVPIVVLEPVARS